VQQPDRRPHRSHRRERLLALAREHKFAVIEDTTLDVLRYDGAAAEPLWAAAPDRVLAVGSLTSLVWGGLRVGWLRAPRTIVLRLAGVKGGLNLGVGAFDQLAALKILDRYDQVGEVRREQASRHMRTLADALAAALPDWPIGRPDGGWSLWIPLSTGGGAAYAQRALRHGVAIAPGSTSSPDMHLRSTCGSASARRRPCWRRRRGG
jgi:DNA-binding transcriptional MocR family regulator